MPCLLLITEVGIFILFLGILGNINVLMGYCVDKGVKWEVGQGMHGLQLRGNSTWIESTLYFFVVGLGRRPHNTCVPAVIVSSPYISIQVTKI